MTVTSLPTLTDGSLGRPKINKPGKPVPDLRWDVPADEHNQIKGRVAEAFEEIGLSDGSTPGSLREAVKDLESSATSLTSAVNDLESAVSGLTTGAETVDGLLGELGSYLAISGTAATITGGYAYYGVENTGALTALTIDPTQWPVGASRRIVKQNTGFFSITLTPPGGSTINGHTAGTAVTLPGSSEPSAVGTGDGEWTVTRISSTAFRCTGGFVRYFNASNAQSYSGLYASQLGASGNGSVSSPSIWLGASANHGFWYDATKGLIASLSGATERLNLRTDGVLDVKSGQGAGTAVLRLTTTAGSANLYVYNNNPEGALTATAGSMCFDYGNGRHYLKISGSGNTGWALVDRNESGTYTPTGAIVSNLDSVTPGSCMYTRVGNIVHVSGLTVIDPTSNALSQWRLTLPVASNLAAVSDLSGGAVSGTAFLGWVYGDTANDAAAFDFGACGTTATNVRFWFTYRVI